MSMAKPLQVLVEYCTAERDERPVPSMSLKGDSSKYTNKLQELEQFLQCELPDVPVFANTAQLFRLQDELQQRSLGRDYHPAKNAAGNRRPRIGSFEVFLELSIWDGLKGTAVAMLLPIFSKLESKVFPDVRKIVQLVLSTVIDNIQNITVKSMDAQRRTLLHHVIHSSLQYAHTQQLDETSQAVDSSYTDALQAETWESASVRELRMIPQMLMHAQSWRLLREILCSLHFLGTKVRKCGVSSVICDLEEVAALLKQSTSAAYQSSEHSADSKHLSTASESLRRTLGYEVGTCLRFAKKNARALDANPLSIYLLAHRFPSSYYYIPIVQILQYI